MKSIMYSKDKMWELTVEPKINDSFMWAFKQLTFDVLNEKDEQEFKEMNEEERRAFIIKRQALTNKEL